MSFIRFVIAFFLESLGHFSVILCALSPEFYQPSPLTEAHTQLQVQGTRNGGVRPSNAPASGFRSIIAPFGLFSGSRSLTFTTADLPFALTEISLNLAASLLPQRAIIFDPGIAQQGPVPSTVESPNAPIPLSPTLKHS